jgi:hypothetical protein
MNRLRHVRSISAMIPEFVRKGFPLPDASNLSLGQRFAIILRCLVASAALFGGFIIALIGASHDLRQSIVIVRATPSAIPAPSLASIEVRR